MTKIEARADEIARELVAETLRRLHVPDIAENDFHPRVFAMLVDPVTGADWNAGPGRAVPAIAGFEVAWADAKAFLQQTHKLVS